jgi:hypothetical protein
VQAIYSDPVRKKEHDIMAEMRTKTLQQERNDYLQGAERNGTGSSAAQSLAARFDPFHDPYLADPYPFFAQARAAQHDVPWAGLAAGRVGRLIAMGSRVAPQRHGRRG